MLKSLRAAKEDPNCPAPRFHEETKERKEEHIFAHLSPNEIELTIVGCKALALPGQANICAYVYGEFQIGDNSPQKFYTGYVTSPSPNFNYVTKFLFDRSKKTHCRFFEHKKTMVLHVAHKKTIGSVDIGVFEVKFSDLLTSSESKQIIPITADSRKLLGSATAEVILRVHEPIAQKECIITTEKELVLDEPIPEPGSHVAPKVTSSSSTVEQQPQGKSAVSQVASHSTMVSSTTTPTPTPTQTRPTTPPGRPNTPPARPSTPPARPATPPKAAVPTAPPTATPGHSRAQATEAASPPAKLPPTPTPAPTASPAPKQTAAAPAASGEEEIDPESLDRVCSNEVFEWEEKRCQAQINKHILAKTPIPEDLSTKLQQIKVALTILVVKVQKGVLSPDDYKKQLEDAVIVEQNIANKLLAAGKKELTRVPLQRVALMKKEIKDIEEGGDEEEDS
ncbi:coiled-coil and C2 domain-containing protein 1 [Pelomyxa schiedti]|nr:coiled-coil and C2 domain-containing protein 1 [Pelomyxa schiedti]